MYINKELHEPVSGDWDNVEATLKDGKVMDSIHGCSDDELRHQALAGYYACITHIDHQIGRIITALENDGTFNDTIIIFTSDHGEMLFDHHLFRKVVPYEGSTHIPLIVHVGKNIARTDAHISESIVELRDIMPTILDMCHLDIPDTCDGLSFKNDLTDNIKLDRTYLHGEHSGNYEQSNQWILTDKYKYIWFTQTDIEQFFDMQNDRKERHNLIDDENLKDEIDYHRQLLIKELEGREEGYTDGERLIPLRKPQNYLRRVITDETLAKYKMQYER